MTDDLHSRVSQVEYRVGQAESRITALDAEAKMVRHDMRDKIQEVVGDLDVLKIEFRHVSKTLDDILKRVSQHQTGLTRAQGVMWAAGALITLLSLLTAIYAVVG